MKLIDKDALVAEIERLKGKISDSSSYCNGWQHALRMLEISIYTLEVKEVDLEKEMDKYFDEHDEEFCRGEYLDFAKHFFELGLKTQKGEEVDLDKEIDLVEDKYHGFESLSRSDVIEIIKYFFELGLKENRYKT